MMEPEQVVVLCNQGIADLKSRLYTMAGRTPGRPDRNLPILWQGRGPVIPLDRHRFLEKFSAALVNSEWWLENEIPPKLRQHPKSELKLWFDLYDDCLPARDGASYGVHRYVLYGPKT